MLRVWIVSCVLMCVSVSASDDTAQGLQQFVDQEKSRLSDTVVQLQTHLQVLQAALEQADTHVSQIVGSVEATLENIEGKRGEARETDSEELNADFKNLLSNMRRLKFISNKWGTKLQHLTGNEPDLAGDIAELGGIGKQEEEISCESLMAADNRYGQVEEQCYYLGNDTMVFDAAVSACADMNGELTAIKSSAVTDYICEKQAQLGLTTGIWIGGKRVRGERVYRWLSGGEPIEDGGYTNWQRQRPFSGAHEACMAVARLRDCEWVDVYCSDYSFHYFCKINVPLTA